MANASGKSVKTAINKSKDNRYIVDRWKLYLDSCATYHSFFVEKFLTNVQDGNTTLTGSCNASTAVTNTRGLRDKFKVWLNKQGISNLLSVPMLESAGCVVSLL